MPIQSDVAKNPDRLWIDLVGTRLHPNLAKRVFPVGDGLLEQVRVGRNREDVVRIVLDFKNVWEHQVFYLDNPTRLVIDVRGEPAAGHVATARPAPGTQAAPPQPAGVSSQPSAAAAAPTRTVAPAPTTPSAAVASRPPDESVAAFPRPSAELPMLPASRRVTTLAPSAPAAKMPAPIQISGVDQLPPGSRRPAKPTAGGEGATVPFRARQPPSCGPQRPR